jgi:hypothetical protein
MEVSNNKKPDSAAMQMRVFFTEAYAAEFSLTDE